MSVDTPNSPPHESMSGDIDIQIAGPQDLESIAAVMEVAYANTYPNDRGITRDMFEGNESFRRHLREYLIDQLADPNNLLLIAREGDAIDGTIGLSFTPEKPTEAEVWGFYVDPNLQQKGIGSELWNHLMKNERMTGIQKLHLTVAKDSKVAKAFYDKQGFVVTGEEDWDWPHWTESHPHNQYWKMKKDLNN